MAFKGNWNLGRLRSTTLRCQRPKNILTGSSCLPGVICLLNIVHTIELVNRSAVINATNKMIFFGISHTCYCSHKFAQFTKRKVESHLECSTVNTAFSILSLSLMAQQGCRIHLRCSIISLYCMCTKLFAVFITYSLLYRRKQICQSCI